MLEYTEDAEDHTILVDELKEEIIEKERLRAQLLRKLKERIIENIKLR